MNKTKISWTDQTANPIRAINRVNGKRGWHCVKVSPGCASCYAERINRGPYGNGLPFREDMRANVELYLESRVLWKLEHQRTGKRTFLCDMTDLFQKDVSRKWIEEIWNMMHFSPKNTYQILTKRADRMQEILSDPAFAARYTARNGTGYPLKNVWLGVSVENQQYADERIPHLLSTPAALRFLSCEPLLGAIDLTNVHSGGYTWESGTREPDRQSVLSEHYRLYDEGDIAFPKIDWVICGGESGANFRSMNPDWARSIRDQCASAGTAFWFKQGAAFRSETDTLLDGVEYHQFPETVTI